MKNLSSDVLSGPAYISHDTIHEIHDHKRKSIYNDTLYRLFSMYALQ